MPFGEGVIAPVASPSTRRHRMLRLLAPAVLIVLWLAVSQAGLLPLSWLGAGH